jgi:fatty aldehyde-generating acyl-ACP reductase
VRGCLLEGMVLAMEGRRDSFSKGRGQITPEKIEEIWEMALRHGFPLAPFFYGSDYWDVQPAADQAGVQL